LVNTNIAGAQTCRKTRAQICGFHEKIFNEIICIFQARGKALQAVRYILARALMDRIVPNLDHQFWASTRDFDHACAKIACQRYNLHRQRPHDWMSNYANLLARSTPANLLACGWVSIQVLPQATREGLARDIQLGLHETF
jgi:hypothetical protein|tara:strand:- start:186 stop:608 length:423 start_codon:yes stop_codon:yes gene_type:complete